MNRVEWSPEEFARLVALPADHPERREAERNPAFVARLRMLEGFESGADPVLGPTELAHARERLQQALARETARPGAPARVAMGPSRRVPPSRPGWLEALWSPGSRLAVGFTALAIVSVVAWRGTLDRALEPNLRGQSPTFALTQTRSSEGALHLTWPAAASCDSYRLRFLDESLHELARVDVGAATTYVLTPGTLPTGLTSGQHVLVEVVGLAGGDEIVQTSVQSIDLP